MTGDAETWIVILIGCFALSSCNIVRDEAPSNAHENRARSGSSFYGGNADEENQREAFDEDRARDAAEAEISGESYTSVGAPYGCTDDCSGHEAGFQYRSENGYAGENEDSPSFNEGGKAFDDAVEERVDEMRSDYEEGDEVDY